MDQQVNRELRVDFGDVDRVRKAKHGHKKSVASLECAITAHPARSLRNLPNRPLLQRHSAA